MDKCIFCDAPSAKQLQDGKPFGYRCGFCGTYYLGDYIRGIVSNKPLYYRRKISSVLYERNIVYGKRPIFIVKERNKESERFGREKDVSVLTLGDLLSYYPRNALERIDRSLLSLSKKTEYLGSEVKINDRNVAMFFQISNNLHESFFVINQLIEYGYVKGRAGFPGELVVTAKGWNRIYELQKSASSVSKQVFVAMNFDPEFLDAYQNGIAVAVKKCGYNPYRVDQDLKVDMIDDKIIAEIKRSKFLIADCTGDKKGVYFEAGLAMGLSLPVIWMVKDGHFNDLHFDTRQFAHIVWKDNQDIITKLENKIRAAID